MQHPASTSAHRAPPRPPSASACWRTRVRPVLHRPHGHDRAGPRSGGWHDARLEPYGPIPLDPATAVFHYAQELFEGLKAYRQRRRVDRRPSGRTRTRPGSTAPRAGMAMPELPEELFVDALELLVRTDRDWVPDTEGHSLYLRPFMFATESASASTARRRSSCSSSSRPRPARTSRRRSSPSRCGCRRSTPAPPPAAPARPSAAATTPPPSSPRPRPSRTAATRSSGSTPCEHRWVEEMGGMNLFFVYGSGDRPAS